MPPTSSLAARTIRVAVSTASRGTSGYGTNSTGGASTTGSGTSHAPSPSSGLHTGDGHRLNRPWVMTRIA